MSLKAIKGMRGEEQAFCTCDDCGAEVTIPARHGDRGNFTRAGMREVPLHSEASVITTLGKLGWSNVKNRLRCPKCTEARKEHKQEANMATAPQPARQMTEAMETDIMEALFASYDRKAKRYTGSETDATVAEAVGGGCMPGWVAAVRAKRFGPAGNEEAEAIRAEVAKIEADFAARIKALTTRLDALYKAEDKRVRA